MKIAFFEVREGERELLRSSLPDHELFFYRENLTRVSVDLAQGAEIVSVFVHSSVSKEVIDLLLDTKYITIRATGFDNLDVDYARSNGKLVSNVPGYGASTVAEFTFALLLNLSRNISKANKQAGVNSEYDISQLRGFDLHGKTLGVIGAGKIGKSVIRIARGFGMKVLANDAFPDPVFAKEVGFEYVSLNDLISGSDVVTIHAPYNKQTHYLLNKENMLHMKEGSYLINTARGEIVDTEALVVGLKSGRIIGAGLDVVEREELIRDLPNVLITPHIAFYTKEAETEIIKITVENIMKFSEGKPQNLV